MVLIWSLRMWLTLMFIILLSINNIVGKTQILFSNGKGIHKFMYGSSVYSKVLDGNDDIQSIACSLKENLVFYTNSLSESFRIVIEKVGLNGKKRDGEIVIDASVENDYKGLAVDWVTKKLYFTDMAKNRIEVCRYDGSYRRAIVSEKVDQPAAITLHPQKGYMFVTDFGDVRKIVRYDMDGRNEKVLDSHVVLPYSIAIDVQTDLLFYGDISLNQIMYMTINGTDKKVLKSNVYPNYMSVYNNILFWTVKSSIKSVNILYPNNVTTKSFSDLPQVMTDLTILSDDAQPDVESECSISNGGCSHLCLLTPAGHSCACPTGIALKADNRTCEKGMKKFLLIARKKNIRLMSLDADQKIDVVLPIKGLTRAIDVEYDILHNRVYWSDSPSLQGQDAGSNTGTINSAFINGSGLVNIIPFVEINSPDSLAIDWNARNLYWTDPLLKRIEVSRLDGSSRKIIVAENLARPRGIAVDPGDGKIYWSDWGNISRIESADLDGENRKVLVSEGLKWPNGITLDYQNRMLYWVDAKYKVVKKYNLNTGEITEVKSVDTHPYDISALGDYVYWTDWFRKVVKMNIHTKKTTDILTGMVVSDIMGIKAVNMDPAYGNNSCYYKTNKCSHLCFHKPKLGAICACPTQMELSKDGKSCTVPSGFLLFSLAEGIMKTSIDTFRTKHKLPLGNAGSVTYQDTFFAAGRIFWLDHTLQTINAAYLNGSDLKVLVKGGLDNANGLAVDWMAQNIYWLSQGCIEVARLDGYFRKVLTRGGNMNAPMFIAVNPHIRKLFWFNKGTSRINPFTLWEASLDGTGHKRLEDRISQPLCIAIDYDTNVIYWTQYNPGTGITSLRSFDLQTSRMSTPYDNLARYSKGMVFAKHFIYADHSDGAIKQVSLNEKNPPSETLIQEEEWIHSIKAFHGSMQKGNNSCSVDNGGCSHLCFAISLYKHVCNCGTHFKLHSDGKTCEGPKKFIIFASGLSLIRLTLDSSKPEAILPISNDKKIISIDYDAVRGYVYWLLVNQKVIVRSHQDGAEHEVIHLTDAMQKHKSSPHDFSLDFYSNSLYWTDELTNSINFLQLTTRANGTVYRDIKKTIYPRKIVVYPEMALMFWNDVKYNRIFKSTLVGTKLVKLKTLHKDSYVQDLTLDFLEKRLYWLDSRLKRIYTISIYGGDEKKYELPKQKTNPVSLGIHGKSIFWTDVTTKYVHKAWTTNLTYEGDTIFHGMYSSISDMVVVNITRKKEKNPCLYNNGGCSHICSISYISDLSNSQPKETSLCGCPLDQEMLNSTQCVNSVACREDEIHCAMDGVCISKSLVCDKKCDCQDCQDEKEKTCNYTRNCYHPSLFKCGRGCYTLAQKCDGVKDCPNNEDENDVMCNPCEEDQFHCGTHICINLKMQCDGNPDCADGIDEKSCPTNGTVPTATPTPLTRKKESRLMPGIISGIVICFIVIIFVILLYLKLRNSKKNAARERESSAMWAIAERNEKTGSITSDDQAKSSVSTYISTVSHNTEPLSFYDRNNVTGASSSVASGYSHLPYNPPPSPIALSTITENNDPYAYATCEQCRSTIQEVPMEEIRQEAPPPTLASTGLLEEVDLYYPIQQPRSWQPTKTICNSCETSRSRPRKRHSNHRPEQSYRSNGVLRYPVEDPELEALYQSHESEMDSHYDSDSIFLDRKQRHPLFDPPPTPCTYLSDDERPPSPTETEQSLAFSGIHRGDARPHYAPPPSPTSQL